MFWIFAAPTILFALVALADVAVTFWVEVAERRRRRRYAMRQRTRFSPVVIEGGKATESGDDPAGETVRSKTA